MSIDELPDEVIQVLAEQWPCRDQQLRQLRALLSPHLPAPETIVLQGPKATGKSSLAEAYLQANGLPFVILRCEECITERHLLERSITAVEEVVKQGGELLHAGKCENLNALATQLQDLLKDQQKFVLVYDGVDRQRDAGPTLGPALARLGELIPSLITILIVRDSPAGAWRKAGLPHILFPPYTRSQSIHIVSRHAPDIFSGTGYDDAVHQEDKAWLWPRFCAAVWDSLGQSAARDLVSFRQLCHKLWQPFVAPVVSGELGTRDFSRLMVMQRHIFQDEDVLIDRLIPGVEAVPAATHFQLPYYAKWIVLAAFLASTNPARLDQTFFMKTTEKKKKKKKSKAAVQDKGTLNNKMPRHLMAPTPFPLDRLLSILHAILPDDLRMNIDIQTQITTLTSLRLMARSAGFGLGDALEPGSKWKIGPAVTWEMVSSIAASLDFTLSDYMVD